MSFPEHNKIVYHCIFTNFVPFFTSFVYDFTSVVSQMNLIQFLKTLPVWLPDAIHKGIASQL